MTHKVDRIEPVLPELLTRDPFALDAPPEQERLRARPAMTLDWSDILISILLHALILAILLLGIPAWFPDQSPDEKPIEVSLVPEPVPTPKPAPPPAPQGPPPLEKRSSDASSDAPGAPREAVKGEAAPEQPNPGPPQPQQAPKAAAPQPLPSPVPHAETAPKQANAETQRRSAQAVKQPVPPAEMAAITAPPLPEPPKTGQPVAPGLGKAAATGFAVQADQPPGGEEAAVYDAYLATIRDQIYTQRRVLRNYFRANQQVTIGILLDRAGRPIDMGLIEPSDSLALNSIVLKMVALAGTFPPVPATMPGPKLGIRFEFRFPPDREDWERIVGP